MKALAVQADPMLERARRLGALTARLPALPVHDWLDRAASVVAEVTPEAAVLAALACKQGSIERLGAAGPEHEAITRDSKGAIRRVERLPPLPHTGLTIEPAPRYLTTRLGGRFARGRTALMASAALAGVESRRLVVVVAGGRDAGPVLQLAMPELTERALAALGPTPSESTQWLLPGDLALIEGLVAGKTIPEIARETHRKEHAVQDAIKAMYRRLGGNRRTVLVARAVGHVPAGEVESKAR